MVDGYSAQQIRAAEAPHLAAGEPLMQRAAAALAKVIAERLPAQGKVLLLIGSGNNGGDALFAGARLAGQGHEVRIARLGAHIHSAGLAAALASGANLVASSGAQAPGQVSRGFETGGASATSVGCAENALAGAVVEAAAGIDVVVDGILGTGAAAHPAVREPARSVLIALQSMRGGRGRPQVVAVDIPSGIDPDSGAVPDPAVLRADVTVTFGGMKAGLLRGPAVDLAGEVRLIDVGISGDLAQMTPLVRGR